MMYTLLADTLLVIHFVFILFVLFGGLLMLYKRWLAWLHIPMMLWGSMVNVMGWVCPLTPLENKYRALAGQSGYDTGFVEHYIAPLVYPEGLTYELGLTVGSFVIVWNIFIYSVIYYQLKQRTN